MKILELERGLGGGIRRGSSKLRFNTAANRPTVPNWDVALGRLVDNAKMEAGRQSKNEPAVSLVSTHLYPLGQAEVETLFNDLADEWEAATEFLSMTPQIVGHSSYFSIVALGPPAVPLILKRLSAEVRPWFQALAAMTRENPASEAQTNGEAAAAWLKWGRRRGLIE